MSITVPSVDWAFTPNAPTVDATVPAVSFDLTPLDPLSVTGGYKVMPLLSLAFTPLKPHVSLGDFYALIPRVEWDLTPLDPSEIQGKYHVVPPVIFPFTLLVAEGLDGAITIEVPALDLGFNPLIPSTLIIINSTIPSVIIHRCYMTGDPDLVIPIESFQARYRSSGRSYLSVVVPNGTKYGVDIAARADGQLVIERGVRYNDGTQQLVELIRVDINDIDDDWGGNSRSIKVAGHRTFVNSSPKSVNLVKETYRFYSQGVLRFRSAMDLNLRPGDTAVIGLESMVVDNMTYTVGDQEIMEIAEA